MASASNTQELETEFWKLAKYGVCLMLNNRTTEAEELFRTHMDNLQMLAGYGLTVFLDALMSFEDEKVNIAANVLKDIEKRCNFTVQNLKSSKKGSTAQQRANYLESLECQIILADVQVCLSTLTFLQNDLSGYLKGGWVLRKAWKVYQHTYSQIEKIYIGEFGILNLPGPNDFQWTNIHATPEDQETIPSPTAKSSLSASLNLSKSVTDQDQLANLKNGYTSSLSHSQSSYVLSKKSQRNFMKRSDSVNSSMSGECSSSSRGISSTRSMYSFLTPISSQLSYLSSSLSIFNLLEHK